MQITTETNKFYPFFLALVSNRGQALKNVKGSQSLCENSGFNFSDLSMFERLYLQVTLQAMKRTVNNELNYGWNLCGLQVGYTVQIF
jgi:hypothetical protein